MVFEKHFEWNIGKYCSFNSLLYNWKPIASTKSSVILGTNKGFFLILLSITKIIYVLIFKYLYISINSQNLHFYMSHPLHSSHFWKFKCCLSYSLKVWRKDPQFRTISYHTASMYIVCDICLTFQQTFLLYPDK